MSEKETGTSEEGSPSDAAISEDEGITSFDYGHRLMTSMA